MHREQYLAIEREMYTHEELLWYGRPCPEKRFGIAEVLGSLIWGMFIIILVGGAFESDFGLSGWQSFLLAWTTGFFIGSVLIPWLRGETLYALTDRRAMRVHGRWNRTVESVWLSNLTSLTITESDGFGCVRCACLRRTWAQGKRNVDRQPIFRRIVNPRGVYHLILTVRPDLASSTIDLSQPDPSNEQLMESRGNPA